MKLNKSIPGLAPGDKTPVVIACAQIVSEQNPPSTAVLAASAPPLTVAPKILIVDDSRVNAVLIERILQSEGFQTLTASSGPAARAICTICATQQPDLILLDVIMPGESGFETCSQLKSDSGTADIPVIFLSALDDVDNRVKGLKMGGVDYIAKPVHREEVLARVRVHLRIRAANRALANEQQLRLNALRDAQQAILVRPEDLPQANFAVYYHPFEEAGGDFYDVVRVDADVFGYFVADISGHGASAAFHTSAVKALLRQYTGPLYSPEDTMRGIDAVMRQMLGEAQYLTACYARLNRRTRQLSVLSAGHPPALVVGASGEAQVVNLNSDPLGMFSAAVLQGKDMTLHPGDRVFLYSDGLIETGPGGRRVGLEALVAACIRHRSLPLAECVARVAQDTLLIQPNPSDDLLLLSAEVDS